MTASNDRPPRALALEVTHDKVTAIVGRSLKTGSVLDCGAGRGALSWRIKKHFPQLELRACDIFPENYEVEGVECIKADLNAGLPYPDESFDMICTVEVVEHLENRLHFFREIRRVLKPGGRLVFSTPNIANAASRLRFLLSGFFTLYKPLREQFANPLHDHISPLTWYFYRYSLVHSGFEFEGVEVDRLKKGAMALVWLYPLMYIYTHYTLSREKDPGLRESNAELAKDLLRFDLLFGRTIIVTARKK